MNSSSDLTSFITHVSGAHNFRVEETLGSGLVRLNLSEAHKRQALQDIQSVEDALVELVRNARDAHASTIYIASSKEGSERRLVVIDDGGGVPAFAHNLIFEPRVTSKLHAIVNDSWGIHGRGMALYSIRTRAQEAHLVASEPGLGSSLKVIFDTKEVPERTDQSSWPQLMQDEDGLMQIVGPHNLLRASVELGIECAQEGHGCKIFYGSPLQIAATMIKRSRPLFNTAQLADPKSIPATPLIHRLALAADPSELQGIAHSLGLDMSLRSAQRVFSAQIRSVGEVISQARRAHQTSSQMTQSRPSLKGRVIQHQGFKPTSSEMKVLVKRIEPLLQELGSTHYHCLDKNIDINVRGTRLTISATFYSDDL